MSNLTEWGPEGRNTAKRGQEFQPGSHTWSLGTLGRGTGGAAVYQFLLGNQVRQHLHLTLQLHVIPSSRGYAPHPTEPTPKGKAEQLDKSSTREVWLHCIRGDWLCTGSISTAGKHMAAHLGRENNALIPPVSVIADMWMPWAVTSAARI